MSSLLMVLYLFAMKIRTLQWMRNISQIYRRQKGFLIEDKIISLENELYLKLALLFLIRTDEEERVKKELFSSEDPLATMARPHEFYHVVDSLRKEFAQWFRELLLHRDFSHLDYAFLALEFIMLDEQVRKQIQIPLLKKMKDLVWEGREALEKGEPTESRGRLKRLVMFFQGVALLEGKKSEILEEAEVFLGKESLSISPLPHVEEFKRVFYQELHNLVYT